MRFKDVLNKYGVTQQDLADRMGMNRVSVSRLLSEKNDLRISTIEKIANAIGCPVAELFDKQNKEDAISDFIALIKQGGELYSASSIAEARVVLDKLENKKEGK
jgi:transcriptional regulator with XRE-family HTH domain